jgi:hypothetical protein
MKSRYKIFGIFTITFLIFAGISCQPQSEDQQQEDAEEIYADVVPLIYHMSFIQRYTTKLYFSGMEENWALADIYAHEIEEITETIIDGNHVDDGVDVSNLMQTMLPAEIENIEAAIDAKDKALFERSFQTLIQTCNKGHDAADYGAVKIEVPENNPFAQDFSAQ